MTTEDQAKAEEMGRKAAELYYAEFGLSPQDDGEQSVGDWDATAWQDDWDTLSGFAERNEDGDYSIFLAAWRRGFWA